jgi:hypothetical protein
MMPVGTTIAIVSVSAVVLTAGGFLAGRATAPDSTVEVLEAQAQQLDTILDGQTEILTAASRPMVIDAELRDKLAETPPACIADPLGLACSLQACWQYGQSSANRPECGLIRDAYIARQACAAE